MKKSDEHNDVYEVVIVGAGIMGCALSYAHLAFTNFRKILLLEKNWWVAEVNSHPLNNAETLHDGATETNMVLEYALKMRYAAWLMATFLKKYADGAFRKVKKGVIGVGDEEKNILEERFKEFKQYFPGLKILRGKEVASFEPKLLEGRKDPDAVVALVEDDGYAVDYQKASEAFLNTAHREAEYAGASLKKKFRVRVKNITRVGEWYEIATNRGKFKTRIAIFAAGSYSLIFAHCLGLGKNFALAPIAGDFYTADNLVDNKVYATQPKSIPVARAHADTAIYNPRKTRLGPTAIIVPFLEPRHYMTFIDFMFKGVFGVRAFFILMRTLFEKDFRWFALMNILYRIPFLGKWLFLRHAARHLFPSLKYCEIRREKGAGGIRPQLIRTKEEIIDGEIKKVGLEMGIGEIFGERAVFIVTPSPGASKSLDTAIKMARWSVKEAGGKYEFDEEKFNEEFSDKDP